MAGIIAPAASTTTSTLYTLTVVNGTGDGEYLSGSTVTIVADGPASGMQFNGWTGATVANAASGSTTITITGSVTVTATYVASSVPLYTLTVVHGTGSGNFAFGTVNTIVANAPATGLVFSAWTGGTVASPSSSTTTVTMGTSPVTVTATYVDGPSYTLTVTSGSGDGTYLVGTVVTIVADAPAMGDVFDAWTGATVASSTSASTTITMPASNTTVVATYTTIGANYTLTVVSGTGGGSFAAGSVNTIIANAPVAGKVFDVWTGDTVADDTMSTTTITMPAAAALVTATYVDRPSYILTVTSGTGDGTYVAGTTQTIVADAPATGKVFDVWTGATFADATASSTTLVMPASDTTVVATYVDASQSLDILDVQQGTHNTTTNALALPAFAVNPSNGDTIIVVYAMYGTANNQAAPTDTGGNTYTQVGTEVSHSGVPRFLGLWYTHNITGGSSFVVTGHLTANSYQTAVAWLVRGDRTYNSDFTTSGGSTGTSPLTTGTSSPAPSSEAIFIGGLTWAAGPTVTAGTGWNTTGSHGFTSGMNTRASVPSDFNVDLFTEYNYSVSTALAATWGSPGGSSGYNAFVASFSSVTQSYTLTVVSGSGSGNFSAGSVNTIIAAAPPTGKVFDAWTGGTVANPAASTTTVTMPAANVTVTATYVDGPSYVLTVTSGSGDGTYLVGTVVTITADAPSAGQVFLAWTGATVANSTSASTTLVMPASNTTVVATYTASTLYTLTVTGGSGSGNFAEADVRAIVAAAPPTGHTFSNWTGGGYRFISHTSAGYTSGGNVTTTAINTTSATLILIAIGDYGAIAQATLTDSASNTWTGLTLKNSSGDARSRLYSCANPTTSATHTFTATPGAGVSIAVLAMAGSKASSPYSAENGAIETGVGTLQPGSITPAAPNMLMLTAVNWNGGISFGTAAIDSGYTVIEYVVPTTDHFPLALAYKIKSNATAENPTWTLPVVDAASAVAASFLNNVSAGGYDLSTLGSTVTSSSTTVTMPTAAVVATATYVPGPFFTLTVNSGTGDGSYLVGRVITITADDPVTGKVFSTWTGGTVASPTSPSTTITIPASNVAVTATYTDAVVTQYTLIVTNGTGDGNYAAGTVVTIVANAPGTGQAFSQWTGGTVANASASTTTVTMPASAVTVTATYVTVSGLPVVVGGFGYAMQTRAAEGGATPPVYLKVKNLNDSGADSLRAAVEGDGLPPRVVIFEVSGTISLLSDINVTSPYLTIAGQTAPPPGITVKGAAGATVSAGGILFHSHDILMQHIRIRTGDGGPVLFSTSGHESTNIYDEGYYPQGGGVYNLVYDHCSISWCGAKLVTVYAIQANAEISFWKTIFGEALFRPKNVTDNWSAGDRVTSLAMALGSKHDIGLHITIYGNLFAHNCDRNPELGSAINAQIVNNVFYDWGKDPAFDAAWCNFIYTPDGDYPWKCDIISNVYIAGPGTGPFSPYYAVGVYSGNSGSAYYLTDAILDSTVNPVVLLDDHTSYRVFSPILPQVGYTILAGSATQAFVLANAGAMPTYRDAVDLRLVSETTNHTAMTGTSCPLLPDPNARVSAIPGRICSQTDVGGWPTLAQNSRLLTVPANANVVTGSGYTVGEEWLHTYCVAVGG
jgi:hypothetical protein